MCISIQMMNRIRNSGTNLKMKNATAAFMIATVRNNSGSDKPALRAAVESTAATTMNRAFKMLFAAMMRARIFGSVRACIIEYSGTL